MVGSFQSRGLWLCTESNVTSILSIPSSTSHKLIQLRHQLNGLEGDDEGKLMLFRDLWSIGVSITFSVNYFFFTF